MSQSNSSNSLGWTNRNTNDAKAVYTVLESLIRKYVLQLVLEALIEHNNASIGAAQIFGAEDDYLLQLKTNLQKALKEYESRHNEFPK